MNVTMHGILLLSWMLCSFNIAQAANPDPNWDTVTKMVWLSFQGSPNMIDRCALKIAHGVSFDSRTAWPAYCNNFKDTEPVQKRVDEIKRELLLLTITQGEKDKLAQEVIWIGASDKLAELSWGRPKKVNHTITSGKTSEQWVYDSGRYLYIENGKVVAIQY
jgi:hypothetical protein